MTAACQQKGKNMNSEKETVLISACLMGCNTRYSGDGKQLAELDALMEKYHLVPVCPEQLGGLTTPRLPSEQQDGRVVNNAGTDVTEQFTRGACEAVRLAKLYGCRLAILKERSPSCGFGTIYDGTFSGHFRAGNGVAADMLAKEGVKIVGESRISELL